MSKSGSLAEKRRVPQQERGERRVLELLAAASAVIVEVGYEAATMTAIAERAGASIGAVYQYFPNKDAVVLALRRQLGDEMEAYWTPLTKAASGMTVEELADGIFEVMVRFMETHPAYMPLLSAPSKYKRDSVARNRLRELFATVFREKRPGLTATEAFRVANVTLQVVKGMNPMYAESDLEERRELLEEYKRVLRAYLGSRLKVDHV